MTEPRNPIRPELQKERTVTSDSAAIAKMDERCSKTAGKLVAARAGSRAAMGDLFEDCRNYLLMVANSALAQQMQSKVAASDLVQETFLEAGQIFGRFHGDSEEELLRWLTRILENKFGNAVKRHVWAAKRDASREVRLAHAGDSAPYGPSLADAALSPSKVVAAGEEGRRLAAALRELPEQYRQVIELRVQQSMSFDEVGRAMNRTSEAARKLFARAIEELRVRIKADDHTAQRR